MEKPRASEQRRLFIRGGLVSAGYYVAAVALFALQLLPQFHQGIFLFVVYVPGVVLLGTAWGVVALLLCWKPWFRGSLLVHTLALVPLWYALLNFSPMGSHRPRLSRAEEAYRAQLARDCRCTVAFYHYDEAMDEEEAAGTFSVHLFFEEGPGNLCKRDDAFRRAYARRIAEGAARVLSRRERYSKIFVGYSSTRELAPGLSEGTCEAPGGETDLRELTAGLPR